MQLEHVLTELEQLARQQQYESALALCDQALQATSSPSHQVRLFVWKARILVSRDGQWGGPAIAHLKSALPLARTPELKARVLAFVAAYAAVGSVALCREYRLEFVAVMHKAKSPAIEKFYPMVEYNHALACHHAEMLETAEDGYHNALAAYEKLNNPALAPFIADVKMNLIDLYPEMQLHEQAYRLLQEVETVLSDATFGAIARLRHAIYTIHRGDLPAALLLVESGLGHSACDMRTRAHLLLVKAQILHARGQETTAHEYAFEAMQVATQAKSNYLCHRVSRFLELMTKGEAS